MDWISKIFKKRGNLLIESEDDNEADIVAECFRTGKTVSGSVDDNGKIILTPNVRGKGKYVYYLRYYRVVSHRKCFSR